MDKNVEDNPIRIMINITGTIVFPFIGVTVLITFPVPSSYKLWNRSDSARTIKMLR
jgi:hypothetical protein